MTAHAFGADLLSRIPSEKLGWLWDPYLPEGKLVILDGDPGVGKSLLTLDLAARLSRGGPLPDGSPGSRPRVTLLLTAEDSAADTVRPRAEAAGADLERMILVSALDGRLVRLPDDIGDLEDSVRTLHADLVVIDPIMAFIPGVAANVDRSVRGVLNLLARLAARTNCTVLLVRHLRKRGAAKSLHRGQGSIGFIGAVRVGLLAAVHPTDPSLRILAVTKTNLGRTPPALGYRVRGNDTIGVVIEWSGVVNVSADALGLPATRAQGRRDRAGTWLRRELAAGPRMASELLTAAAKANIPVATLRRAKKDLLVRSCLTYTQTGDRIWYWYNPGTPWPKETPFRRPLGHELPPANAM